MPRMQHSIISKRDGWYTAFPQLYRFPDGRLAVGVPASPFSDHFAVDRRVEFVVVESRDGGATWTATDDPTIPYSWPGTTPRERYDRFADIMPDGSFFCAGSVGWEIWPVERSAEAKAQGLLVRPHQLGDDVVIVGGHKLFTQRSTDGGRTWSRREWAIPGFSTFQTHQVHQEALFADGTILFSVYGPDAGGNRSATYVWCSTDGGQTFRLHPMGSHADGIHTGETTFLEIAPGRLTALSRTEPNPGYLVQRWSDDGGITWSYPVRCDFWGYPAHLLRLRDGRVLCAYGYRREPMGVRAVLSEDDGNTWDTANGIVLRDDGGTANRMREDRSSAGGDVGYPVSTQLADGSILTVYYITLADGITHAAATRWELP